MFNLFSKINKKRKQDCLLLTEDGRILEISLPVVRGYVAEQKTQEAWGLYPDYRIPKRGTNRLAQVITERDMAPMSLNGDKHQAKRAKVELSKIAQESASEARANVQKKSLKSKTAETLQLLLIILAVTVGVLVLFGLFMSGKLHLPGGGGGGEGGLFSWVPVIFGFLIKGKSKILGFDRGGEF